MSILKEGLKLQRIESDPRGEYGDQYLFVVAQSEQDVKPWHVKSIVVSMEHGQMDMVPWALITHRGGHAELINLANMASITPMKEQ